MPRRLRHSSDPNAEKSSARPPICRREKILVAILSLLIIQTPWFFGGMNVSAQFVSLGLALAGFAFLFFPLNDPLSPAPRQNLTALLKFPVFWISLLFAGYLLIQYFNPHLTIARGIVAGQKSWWLAPLDHISWLPSGLETPYFPMNPLRFLVIWATPLLFMCTLWIGIKRRRSWNFLLWISLINACALSLFGIWMRTEEIFKILGFVGENLWFCFASFYNANQAAMFLYMNLAIALGMFIHLRNKTIETGKSSGIHWLFIFPITILLAGIFITGSRMGFVCAIGLLGIALILWLISSFKQSGTFYLIKSVLSICILLAAIAALGYCIFLGKTPLLVTKIERGGGMQDLKNRVTLIRVSYETAREHPVLGWGAGSFRYVSQPYLKKYPEFCKPDDPKQLERYLEHGHCDWLEMPADIGIVGCLFPAAILLYFLRIAFRRFRYLTGVQWMLFSAITAIGIHAIIDFPLASPTVLLLLALFMCSIAFAPQKTGKIHFPPSGTLRKITTIIFLITLANACQTTSAYAEVVLVNSHGDIAHINSPKNLEKIEHIAITDLSRILQLIAKQSETRTDQKVALIETPGHILLERLNEPVSGFDEAESFKIKVEDNTLRIQAKTAEGFAQGIYWFLREKAGICWYFPGSAGEYIPNLKPWIVQDFCAAPKPSFSSRQIYDINGGDPLWPIRNGLGNPISFSHTLGNIINPEVLSRYPALRCFFAGNFIVPSPQSVRTYHPELYLCAPSAALAATRFFRENAKAHAFSVGLEDNLHFSQSKAELEARGPLSFFRKLPNYSNLVFNFINTTAKTTAMSGYKDKFIGCLAYNWYVNAPPFPMEKNTAVFVASDRTFWHEGAARTLEIELLHRWNAVAPGLLGIYDYIYGAPFIIPRPLFASSKWIKQAHTLGVRGYFAEANPIEQYDYAKLWTIASLLWNINADPDTLTKKWFAARYGKGAPFIESFFRRWDNLWRTQHRNIYWLRNYYDEAQGLLAKERDLIEMRQLLDQAQKAVDDPIHCGAILSLKKQFSISEAFCQLAQAKAAVLQQPSPQTPEAAQHLRMLLWNLLETRARFDQVRPCNLDSAIQKTERSDPSVTALIELASYARAHAQMKIFIVQMRPWLAHPGATQAFKDAFQLLEATPYGKIKKAVIHNPNFKDSRQPTLADFNPLWPEYNGKLPFAWDLRSIRSDALRLGCVANKKGATAFRVENAVNTHLFQWTLASNTSRLFHVRIRGLLSEGAKLHMILTWVDVYGQRRDREVRLFPGDYSKGKSLFMVSPPKYKKCALGIVISQQGDRDWIEISCISKLPQAPIPSTAGSLRRNVRQ